MPERLFKNLFFSWFRSNFPYYFPMFGNAGRIETFIEMSKFYEVVSPINGTLAYKEHLFPEYKERLNQKIESMNRIENQF